MLTTEQIAALTPEQKARYQLLETLFLSDGWNIVETHVRNRALEAQSQVLTAPNWETNRLKTGHLEAFSYMANLREATVQEYAALAQQNSEAVALTEEQEYE